MIRITVLRFGEGFISLSKRFIDFKNGRATVVGQPLLCSQSIGAVNEVIIGGQFVGNLASYK